MRIWPLRLKKSKLKFDAKKSKIRFEATKEIKTVLQTLFKDDNNTFLRYCDSQQGLVTPWRQEFI